MERTWCVVLAAGVLIGQMVVPIVPAKAGQVITLTPEQMEEVTAAASRTSSALSQMAAINTSLSKTVSKILSETQTYTNKRQAEIRALEAKKTSTTDPNKQAALQRQIDQISSKITALSTRNETRIGTLTQQAQIRIDKINKGYGSTFTLKTPATTGLASYQPTSLTSNLGSSNLTSSRLGSSSLGSSSVGRSSLGSSLTSPGLGSSSFSSFNSRPLSYASTSLGSTGMNLR